MTQPFNVAFWAVSVTSKAQCGLITKLTHYRAPRPARQHRGISKAPLFPPKKMERKKSKHHEPARSSGCSCWNIYWLLLTICWVKILLQHYLLLGTKRETMLTFLFHKNCKLIILFLLLSKKVHHCEALCQCRCLHFKTLAHTVRHHLIY